MPEYQYRCKGCSRLFASGDRSDVTRCPYCQTGATRVFAFYTGTGMKEHWNTAVGRYVSNRHDMDEALKRQSDEASVRTGIDHQYEYISPAEMADPSAHGVSEDGLEETRRRHHDNPDLLR
jgi:hypothetical protein